MAKIALPFPIPKEWGPSTAQAIEDNLQRIYGSSGRLGSGGSSALVNGLDLIVPSPGDMIVCTSAGIFVALSLVSTAQRVLTNNGGTPTWALVDLTDGITGVLPYANFTNATVTQRILGRNTAGAGVWEEVTATQLLDWLGAVQGDILYRNGTTWVPLAPGTAGQLLQTGGTGANPSWATPGATSGVIDPFAVNLITIVGRPSTLSFYGLGGATQSVTGTIATTATQTTAASFVNFVQTGTTAGLRAGFDLSRFDFFEADQDPTFEVALRTPATMTNIRIWMCICNASMATNGDDQGGTTQYMGFRYSTVAADAGWIGVVRDGTTQGTTPNPTTTPVAAIAASTYYKLKVRKSGSSVFFSVNGSAEISVGANLPAATTALGFSLQVFNSVNSATHAWDFSRARCYYGS